MPPSPASSPATDPRPDGGTAPDSDEPAGAEDPPGDSDEVDAGAGRSLHVHRFAPLVDGIEYFPAAREALLGARRQVWIVGWEIHSEIDLLRGDAAKRAEDAGEPPYRLGDLLEHLVDRHAELVVRLLIWKGSALFAAERQHLPRMKRPWADHPRIRLEWDEEVPPLASRHRKYVVVDDDVAFVGGMDLTRSRWDSRAHARHDRRRRPPGLLPRHADPYHDLMAVGDDELAVQLGTMARERWRAVTGESVEPPVRAGHHDSGDAGDDDLGEGDAGDDDVGGGDAGGDGQADDRGNDGGVPSDPDRWPRSVSPMMQDLRLTLAVTDPPEPWGSGRRDVEATFLRQIAAAERLIYVETQYLNAEMIADALAARLRDPDGPQVVLLLPWGCPAALQAMALDPHRDLMLDRLRHAATPGRLGIYWVTRGGEHPDDPHADSVYIHAKLLIVDDTLLRIGSANLNGRSMGLDSEADVFLRSRDDGDTTAIRRFRRRLLGDLMAVDVDRVAEAEDAASGDVIAAIEEVRGGRRTLVPFEHRAPDDIRARALPIQLTDPDRPLSMDDVARVMKLMKADRRLRRWLGRAWNGLIGTVRHAPGRLAATVVVLVLIATIAFSPLASMDAEDLLAQVESLASSPLGLLGAGAGFALLATAGVPVTALVVATGMALGAWPAILVALGGAIASAAAGRMLGELLRGRGAAPGDDASRHDDGEASAAGQDAAHVPAVAPEPWRVRAARAARRVSRGVRRHGMPAVAVIRNLPIAPFAVINVACGIARIPWGAYLLGTALGMLPGIVVLSVLGRGIADLLRDPRPQHLLWLGLGLAGWVGLILAGHRLRRRWIDDGEDDSGDDAGDDSGDDADAQGSGASTDGAAAAG